MPLPEQRRQQLDGIVQKMIANKESDANIKFVVDDFVKKYQPESVPQKPKGYNTGAPLLDAGINLGIGAAKGIASTAQGISSLGQPVARSINKAITGNDPGEVRLPDSVTKADGAAQKIGKGIEQFAELALPATKVSSATKGASLLTRIGAEAATGASIVGAQTGSPKEAAKAGVISAVLPGVGAATKPLRSEISKFVTEKLPERIIRSAIGQSKKQLLAGKDISKYITENKRIGTANGLITSAQKAIDDADNFIQKNLASVKDKFINQNSIIDDIVKVVNEDGGATDKIELIGTIQQLAPQARGLLQKENLTLQEANKLRSLLDRTLGDKAFLGGQLTYNKELLKTFTDNLREQVKQNAPEGTRSAFEKMSKEITLRNAVLDKYTGKDRNQLLRLSDLFGGVPGAVFGGGVPGYIAGAAASRAAQSPLFLTGSAVGLGKLKNLENVVSQLTPEIKSALIQMFRD